MEQKCVGCNFACFLFIVGLYFRVGIPIQGSDV